MIVYTVSQLLEMSDGTVPEAFRGKIKKVFAANKGTNRDNQPYSLQKIIVTDGAKEIEIMLDGRNDLSRTNEGSQIFAASVRGERGLSGLKRKDNVWKERTTPQVWIYDRAEMTIEGANGNTTQSTGATPPPGQQPQAHAPQPATPPATNGHANGNGNGNGAGKTNGNGAHPPAGGIVDKRSLRASEMKGFDKRIGRTTAALSRCFDASVKLIADVNKRHDNVLGKPTAELVEKIAMGLMVNACWNLKPAELENFPLKAFQICEEEDAKFNNQSAATPPTAEGARHEGVPFN